MRLPIIFIIALSIVVLFGCSTTGVLELSTGQVSVSTSDQIKADKRKREELLDHAGVNRLHDHVLEYVKRFKIRNSLKLDITISTLRIGWGRDHMSTQTVISEHGKELGRFRSVSTTSRGKKIKRFAKDLATQISLWAKEINDSPK